MKRTIISSAISAIAALAATTAKAQTINVEHKGDTTVIVVDNPTKYLILPIEEERDEAKVKLDLGRADDTCMDVRLAIDRIDYEVPFELSAGKRAVVKMLNIDRNALALKKMRLMGREKHRLLSPHLSPHTAVWMDERCQRTGL